VVILSLSVQAGQIQHNYTNFPESFMWKWACYLSVYFL